MSEESTLAHCTIQLGSALNSLPTRSFMTSNFTSAASAGTLRYSSTMNSSAQATDTRASDTVGVV